jgi:hypothetical protein
MEALWATETAEVALRGRRGIRVETERGPTGEMLIGELRM